MTKPQGYLNKINEFLIQEMKVITGIKDSFKNKYFSFNEVIMDLKNKKEKYLIFLVGLPSSGKSTFTKKFKKSIGDQNVGILERDGMVILNAKLINKTFNTRKLTYDMSFEKSENKKTIDKNIDDLMSIKEKKIKDKKFIIIDMTNMTKVKRSLYIKKYSKTRKIIVIDFYKNLHQEKMKDFMINKFVKKSKNRQDQEKNEVNKKTINLNVYKRMIKDYQEPQISEGINKIYNINKSEIINIIRGKNK